MTANICGSCYQPIDEDDEDVYECESCEQALCRNCYGHRPLCDGCAGGKNDPKDETSSEDESEEPEEEEEESEDD